MPDLWQPGTQYNYNDEVHYNGANYKIIQPHRSQGDWTPDVTPALWGRMQGGGGGHSGGHGGDHQQQQQQQQQQPYQSDYKPPPASAQTGYGGQHPSQSVDIKDDEKEKNWYDLDEDRRKQIAVGGGLLAGAAAIGAGFFAYKKHKKDEEEEKALQWGLQNWLRGAQERSQQFKQYGPQSAATWVLVQGTNIPDSAVFVGQEKSWKMYPCRAFVDGGIMLGKASKDFKKGAVIGYENEEHHFDTYEVLLGDMNGLKWVNTYGKLNVASLGARPVEGGKENDGTPLYVARAPIKDGSLIPGKASEKLEGAYIPYGDKEKNVKNYEVLCYA
ncbi:hypothetical protein ONZ45_g10488 [Pleurotus djamor]|nr:hypothetical protein ONZ45_g10488 [Pleurotus djamor]